MVVESKKQPLIDLRKITRRFEIKCKFTNHKHVKYPLTKKLMNRSLL